MFVVTCLRHETALKFDISIFLHPEADKYPFCLFIVTEYHNLSWCVKFNKKTFVNSDPSFTPDFPFDTGPTYYIVDALHIMRVDASKTVFSFFDT